MNKLFIFLFIFAVSISVVSAHTISNLNSSCYSVTHTDVSGTLIEDLLIDNTCEGVSISWSNQINLTLGVIEPVEVNVTGEKVFVSSSLRPDLNAPATITYDSPQTVTTPTVLKDGIECGDCNITHSLQGTVVDVVSFSTYTLQGAQDFTLYSDIEPELPRLFEDGGKVYQSVDLGESTDDYVCLVQVFAYNERGDLVLIQTNPEREAKGNFLGDPDTNQPESLGYFQPKNGLANTYFRGEGLAAYNDFELVISCRDSINTLKVYEESFSTRYSPAGRQLEARSLWLTDGDNAFYLVWILVLSLFALWIGGSIWRSVTGRR